MKKTDAFDFNAYPAAGFKADPVENVKLTTSTKIPVGTSTTSMVFL
jgi:hypothetical protein